MGCNIIRNSEGKPIKVLIGGENKTSEIIANVVRNLHKTGLSKDVQFLSDSEIKDKLYEINNNGNSAVLSKEGAIDKIEGELLAVHNIKEDGLRNVLKLGGIPVPSIAIINKKNGFDSFGEISLIGDSNLISPKNNEVDLYPADSYSVRYPKVDYFFNAVKFKKLQDTLDKLFNKKLDNYRLENDGIMYLKRNPLIKLLYLDSNGVLSIKEKTIPKDLNYIVNYYDSFKKLFKSIEDIDLQQVLNGNTENFDKFIALLEDVVDDFIKNEVENGGNKEEVISAIYNEDGGFTKWFLRKVLKDLQRYNEIVNKPVDVYETIEQNKDKIDKDKFNEFVEKLASDIELEGKIFNGFTNEGDKIYEEHTLENVVSIMKNRSKNEEGWNYGLGSLRAGLLDKINDLSLLNVLSDRIVSKEEFEEIKEKYESIFLDIVEKLKPYYKYDSNGFNYMESVVEDIISYNNTGEFTNFAEIPSNIISEIDSFILELKKMPTEYFEAKINRSVSLEEFHTALVPATISRDLIVKLKSLGLTVIVYDKNRNFTNLSPLSAKDNFSMSKEMEDIKKKALKNNTYLKAPNGSSTNLTEKQWLQVRTKSFKEWFGDWENDPENASKVVDKNGEPRVVYHGSAEDINVFDEDWAGTTTANNDYGAFYFSSNYNVAKDYSKQAIIRKLEGLSKEDLMSMYNLSEKDADFIYENGVEEYADLNTKVLSVFLNIRNPLIDSTQKFKSLDTKKTQRQVNFVKNKIDENYEFIDDYLEVDPDIIEDYKEEIEERARYNYDLEDSEPIEDYMFEEAQSEILEENGVYPELRDLDGVIIEHVIDDIGTDSQEYQDEYIVIRPNQIKSAVDNKGSFNSFDNDIRYQMNPSDFEGVKGFVYNGVVYLNKDKFTLDTPIHEFGHLWVDFVKQYNYSLYRRGIELVKTQGRDYIEKVLKSQPNLNNVKLFEEALAEMIGDEGALLLEKTGKLSQSLSEFFKMLWKTIQGVLGISEVEDFSKMTVREFAKSVASDLIKGVGKSKWTAPYTIQPLLNKIFSNKKGKYISVQAIKQVVNQKGVKQIEKDIINAVLSHPKYTAKKVLFDDFEADVMNDIMPLKVVDSETYSSYGADNLGVSLYDSKTHIYNSPLNHGITGHFEADFSQAYRVNIKHYLAEDYDSDFFESDVKLYDLIPVGNYLAIVKSGVTLDRNNIYDNVLTVVDSKEAAIQYLENITNNNSTISNKGLFGHTRVWEIEGEGDNLFLVEIQSDFFQKKSDERKNAILRHLRNLKRDKKLTPDLEKLYDNYIHNLKVVDLSNNPVLNRINNEINRFKLQREIANQSIKNLIKIRDSKEAIESITTKNNDEKDLLNVSQKFNVPVDLLRELKHKNIARNNSDIYTILSEKIAGHEDVLKTADNKIMSEINYLKKIGKYDDFKKYDEAKRNIPTIEKELIGKLPLKDKQFLASQKTHLYRLLREEIRNAAINDYKSLLLPTPFTLANIEGYIEDVMPYEMSEYSDELKLGDEIYFLDEYYTVISTDEEGARVMRSDDVFISNSQDMLEEAAIGLVKDLTDDLEHLFDVDLFTDSELDELSSEFHPIYSSYIPKFINLKEFSDKLPDGTYNLDFYRIKNVLKDYLLKYTYTDIETVLEDLGYSYFFEKEGEVYFAYNEDSEYVMHPYNYKPNTEEDFNVDTLPEQYRTIISKYESLIDWVNKERIVENYTDNSGNSWVSIPLTKEDKLKPVVVFSKELPKYSKVFNELASSPQLAEEESLELYKKFVSENISIKKSIVYNDTGEPRLFYKTEKGVFSSYGDALKNTDNGFVSIGFVVSDDILHVENEEIFEVSNNEVVIYKDRVKLNNSNSFRIISKISSNSNPNIYEGFINYNIKKKLLSDKKVLIDNNYLYKGEGSTVGKSLVNASKIVYNNIEHNNIADIKNYLNGYITIESKTDVLHLTGKNGEKISITPEDLHNKLLKGDYKKLSSKYSDLHSILYYIWRKFNNIYSVSNKNSSKQLRTKEDLQTALMNLLNNIGVSVVSITDYIENYGLRNGVDIDVKALADITNQIIAFAGNEISLEDLTEETMHFIVEAMNKETLATLLPLVDSSNLWGKYYEQYYEKYKDTYSDAELDTIIRKEILAKIIAESLLEKADVGISDSFFDKIISALKSFFSRLNQIITKEDKTELSKITDEIETLLVNEELSKKLNIENFDNSNLVLFSLKDKKSIATLLNLRQMVEMRIRQLQQNKNVEVGEYKQLLDSLTQEASAFDESLAIKTLLGVVSSQVGITKKMINHYIKRSKLTGASIYFSQSEKIILQSLLDDFLPILKELQGLIVTDDIELIGLNKELIKKQISQQINDISLLEGLDAVQTKNDVSVIAERVLSDYNLEEDEKEKIIKSIDQEVKDISWLQAYFGSLTHAGNTILGLLGKIIQDYHFKGNQRLLKTINPFLKKIEDKKLDLNYYESIIEKKDGKHTKYFLNPYLFSKFEEEERKAKYEAYKLATSESLTYDEYVTKERLGLLKSRYEFVGESLKRYNDYMDTLYANNTERMFEDSFYEERKNLYSTLGLSDATISFLQYLSRERFNIISKYVKYGDTLDYDELTEKDRMSLERLKFLRKQAKSNVDYLSGEYKTGDDLTISEDLQKLDKWFAENNKGKNYQIKTEFFDKLKSQGSDSLALLWFNKNAGFKFNDLFWEDIKKEEGGFIDKLKNVRDTTDDDYVKAVLEDKIPKVEELLEKRRELLKQFKSSANPSEIDTSIMSLSTMAIIKQIEEELQDSFMEVNRYLEKNEDNTIDIDELFENTLNTSFYNDLKEFNGTPLEFIIENTTQYGRVKIEKFRESLNRIKKGSNYVDTIVSNYFDNNDIDTDPDAIRELLENTEIDDIVFDFGKDFVVSYYKRFAPAGYDDLIYDLEQGNVSIVDVVDSIVNKKETSYPVLKYLDVNPHFSWKEDNASNSKLNPNYDFNFKGGIRQPKVDKYLNDDFFTTFGIDKNKWIRERVLLPTKNVEKFEILQDMWDKMEEGYKNYQESNANIYKLPQFSKRFTESLKNTLSPKGATTLANKIKDIIYNRVDDLQYGAKEAGVDLTYEDAKVLPKYGIYDLEEESDISHELAYSIAAFLQSAYQYDEKLNVLSEVSALESKLLSQNFENGKAANKTNAYTMFKEFTNAYIYGVKSNKKVEFEIAGRKIDLSKIARKMDGFVRAMNIGFGVPIAVTGYTTGLIFKKMESYIGEYTNRDSAKWASKELLNLTKDFISDTGKINKENRLNMLMEKFGVHDVMERTHSSGFNRIVRAMNNLPYKFQQMANYPIIPHLTLTMLDNYRLVGDKFLTYQEYKKLPINRGKTVKEIKDEWSKFREHSLYNLLEKDENTLTMEFPNWVKDKFEDEYLDNLLSIVQGNIREINAVVDSIVPNEDKSLATRHFLLSFMTAHRGWMVITAQKKFKGRHFNFMTGKYEEGHYTTALKLINDVFKVAKESDGRKFIEIVKEEWYGLSDYEKMNLRRIAMEWVVFGAMLGIGLLVAGIADDDDNKDLWVVQFLAYIYFRTTNEVGSVQAPTGVFGITDVIDSPFIAINTIKQVIDFHGYSLEEIDRGVYKGHSKLYKKLAKITWGRHYYQLKDIKKTSDYYRLLNANVLIGLTKRKKEK